MILLKLWTLCNAVTQALTLLSTDNETKSNASMKEEAIYEDVPNVGGDLHCLKVRIQVSLLLEMVKHLLVQNQIQRLLQFRQRRAKRLKKRPIYSRNGGDPVRRRGNLHLLLLLMLLFSPLQLVSLMWAGNIVGSPFLSLCFMMMTCLLPLVVLSILHNYFPSRDSKMTT